MINFSEAEGHAMLKIRDKADYKALENIGLVEPDDPAKALELGFPNRAISKQCELFADQEPVPMTLGELVGLTESVISETTGEFLV